MTPSDQELISEIKNLNKQLKKLNSRGGIVGRNMFAGFFHSVGSLIGTAVLFVILIIFASRLNIANNLAKSFEQFMSQIRWEKIIPATQINTPNTP